jgi:GNAT superfamily N-acetyltransferase
MSATLPIVDYDRDRHEPALRRFTAKVLGEAVCERRQRVIDTFHDGMPGREHSPLRHVLMDGDIVAGTLGYMPAEFLVNGQRVQARYTHDLLVDPDYRGGGLGKRIVAHARETGDFYPGGMWMTGQCHKIHQQTGFDDVANLVTYTAVLDPGAFAARRGFSPLKSAVTRTGLGVTRMLALRRARGILSRAQSELTTVKDMDPAHDTAWMLLAKTYVITRVRDAAYLNWKYGGHPILNYRTVVATRKGAAQGYMVWRPAPEGASETRAAIVDFLVAKGDTTTLQELASHVLVEASAAGIDAVAMIATQEFATAALQKLGFVAGGSRNSWVIANWKNVLPADAVSNLDLWHMCMGDSDGDIWTGAM